jgi:hypothetical protein
LSSLIDWFLGVASDPLRRIEKNIPRAMQSQACADTAAYILKHMPDAEGFNGRFDVLRYGLSLAQTMAVSSTFCEFGVFKGYTANLIAKMIAPLYLNGFDSFEGLPETWQPRYRRGHFAFKDWMRNLRLEGNVNLHAGKFSDTVPSFKASLKEPICFIHMDCDLYSSASYVLKELSAHIGRGTIIVFDEYFNYPGWRQHEHAALQEFIATQNLKYRYLAYATRSEPVAIIFE